VRNETKIGNSAVSVSFVAVELAKKIFGALEEKVVLLIGAGEMSELAARHLVSGGVKKVLVVNRTYERAVTLAEEFKGEPIPFDEMAQGLRKADIVISATNSPEYLIRHDPVAKVIKDRKQKPIFFIDIADPGYQPKSVILKTSTSTTSMTFNMWPMKMFRAAKRKRKTQRPSSKKR
jgi:glutamyl-tRNA reductase